MDLTVRSRSSKEHRCARCEGLMSPPMTRAQLVTKVRTAMGPLEMARTPVPDLATWYWNTLRAAALDALQQLGDIDREARGLCGSCFAGVR